MSRSSKDKKSICYISEIQFNNGEIISINKNDIIVFVGPNNAGKSQSLKDIHNLCRSNIKGIVISEIKLTKEQASISKYLEKSLKGINNGNYLQYQFLNSYMNIFNYSDSSFSSSNRLDEYTDYLTAFLDTSARLTICQPAMNINRDNSFSHPIHCAAFDRENRKWLSENFKKAFGNELIPNTQFGGTIPLCIGESVKLNEEFTDEQERLEKYGEILSKYDQVQNQGDGIKSFTGILLYLMLDNYCTYLIDEPESFLHPPQANIMGQIIGRTLTDEQQAFISTHSEEIIKGISSVCPNRLKIIRITRDKNVNSFATLDNKQFNKIWSDPLLKYSNIMSSLFHKNVVLCESDSDCKLYSIMDNHLKSLNNKYSETLFIHCSGKHRMPKIISALLSLKIDVKLIPDLDILDDKKTFSKITDAFDIPWDEIEKDYNVVVSSFNNTDKITRNDARTEILRIIDENNTKFLSNSEIDKIKDSIRVTSKWETLKKGGVTAIPSGDATKSFETINKKLKKYGIYIVTEGELENFIKAIGGHGPDWVNKVLEAYPNLNDDIYSDLRKFVIELDLK